MIRRVEVFGALGVRVERDARTLRETALDAAERGLCEALRRVRVARVDAWVRALARPSHPPCGGVGVCPSCSALGAAS